MRGRALPITGVATCPAPCFDISVAEHDQLHPGASPGKALGGFAVEFDVEGFEAGDEDDAAGRRRREGTKVVGGGSGGGGSRGSSSGDSGSDGSGGASTPPRNVQFSFRGGKLCLDAIALQLGTMGLAPGSRHAQHSWLVTHRTYRHRCLQRKERHPVI